MATWTGTTPYATKKQLVSSISGLYDDLQDLSGFDFQNLAVSTLTAELFISTPVLYVSSIIGATIDISGIIISNEGILNAPIVSLSSLSFKGLDKLFDLDVSFDLGLGDAVGGALGGLGALVGGGLIAVGTGLGLAVKGAEQGIATMIAGRPQNFISETNYETINFTTQLQVSTLGNAYPLYSTIIRTVSSVAPDQVPGREIFVSTFFTPGQICIRSVSDPFNLITGNSNLNTSTIQSFGQWVPIQESASLVSTFTSITLSNATDTSLLTYDREALTSNQNAIFNGIQNLTYDNYFDFPVDTNPYPYAIESNGNKGRFLYHRDEYTLSNTYISTPFVRFQSTITTNLVYFIQSTISSPAEFTYSNGTFGGDIAICEPDESGFRSTATFDFIAQGQELFIQWGLSVDNLNSTIAAGTAKRVTWDIPGGTSNFINIPVPQSTLTGETTQQILSVETNPYEFKFLTLGTAMAPSRVAWDVTSMTFGSNTTLSNYQNYPYAFTDSLYVNGTIEAQTIIALSSIFATSTFVDTQISTTSIVADLAIIREAYITDGYLSSATIKEGFVSTLKSTPNYLNDYITSLSRHRFAGFQTPISIVTGTLSNLYDPNARFDFTTDSSPQAMFLQSQPANINLMTVTSTNIQIANLDVTNLTASNLIYGKAEAPAIETSTIIFGWTGSFDFPTVPKFSMSQSLTTEPGLVYTNYAAASNQTFNIMAFSNTVNMLAQQFSTPLISLNTSFGNSNIQGWASTIFTNADTSPKRVNLVQGSGKGELSLQAGNGVIAVSLNTVGDVGGAPVPIYVGSTYKFTSDGTSWGTLSNAPTPGTIQYNNAFQMTMDFENLTISTTDTLNLNAEKVNFNGLVAFSNVNAEKIYLNSAPATDSGLNILREYIGVYNGQSVASPVNITNTVVSSDFTNNRPTVNPNRGYNAFNSYNFNEWNNSSYNIDTVVGSGLPTIILGDLITKPSSFPPYAGQFFINNGIDSPASNIPIYVNRQGLLSSIGFAPPNNYSRVFTTDGTNWSLQSNVINPQGLGGYTFSNFYTVQMNSAITQVTVGQPLVEVTPSRTMTTNKLIMDCPQVRVYTIESPSFPSKESGFEFSSYFDANIVFDGTQSDAVNPILNSLQNYYYSVAGWSAQCWFGRMRTKSTGIQGYDIIGIAQLITGTPGDFIWASARYINVVSELGSPSGNIREMYFMTPKNYHTSFSWLGQ